MNDRHDLSSEKRFWVPDGDRTHNRLINLLKGHHPTSKTPFIGSPPFPTRHLVDNNSQRQLGSPLVNEHQRNQDHIPPGQLGIIDLQPYNRSLLTITPYQVLEINLETLQPDLDTVLRNCLRHTSLILY